MELPFSLPLSLLRLSRLRVSTELFTIYGQVSDALQVVFTDPAILVRPFHFSIFPGFHACAPPLLYIRTVYTTPPSVPTVGVQEDGTVYPVSPIWYLYVQFTGSEDLIMTKADVLGA
jgi:hypothetical protein